MKWRHGDIASLLIMVANSPNTGSVFLYANGQGVPQDLVQARKWLNLAASRYKISEQALKELRDEAIAARDSVAALMTPAQIAEAQKLASDWKPQ